MPQSRFFAALLSLSTAGAMLLGAPLVTHQREALAAVRHTEKQPRRTASTTNDDPAPRAGAAPSDDASGLDSRHENISSSRRSREAAARATRLRRSNDVANGAKRTSETSRDGASPKMSSASVAAPKGAGEPAKTTAEGPRSAPEGTPSRPTDTHISAAKAPETVASVKPATEKFAPETLAQGSGVAPAPRPVVVSFDGPVFDGGDVPRAAAMLDRMKVAFARCAAVDTALVKNEASIDLRFLVRAPGRAEGVNVERARGVSGDVVRCMTSVLARSHMGAPSDDPVGVAVTVHVRKD